jgi:hypothetical protein
MKPKQVDSASDDQSRRKAQGGSQGAGSVTGTVADGARNVPGKTNTTEYQPFTW